MPGLTDQQVDELLSQAETRLAGAAAIRPATPDPPLDAHHQREPAQQQQQQSRADETIQLRRPRTKSASAKSADAGPNWFGTPKTQITPDFKRHWQILRMRAVLDPKNRKVQVKAQIPEHAQLGVVVDHGDRGPARKPKAAALVDELVSADGLRDRLRAKYAQIQERNASGGKRHYKSAMLRRRQREKARPKARHGSG